MPADGGTATAEVANTRVLNKPPLAPCLEVKVSGDDALLDWDAVTKDVDGNTITVMKYHVWRSADPHFAPADPPDHEVLAPDTSYLDLDAVADPDNNWYYVVRARE